MKNIFTVFSYVIGSFAFILISSSALAGGPQNKVGDIKNDHKVRICHATSSHHNQYTNPKVDKHSIINLDHGNGHDTHNGPIWFSGINEDWGDIIPPFTYFRWEQTSTQYEYSLKVWKHGKSICKHGYEEFGNKLYCRKETPIFGWVRKQYDGKNWTSNGQSIHENNCEISNVDLCKDIDGIQTVVPEGRYKLGKNCPALIPVCTDPDATNYDDKVGKNETPDNTVCKYDGSVPEICNDEAAINNGEVGECEYPDDTEEPENPIGGNDDNDDDEDDYNGRKSSLSNDNLKCESNQFDVVMDLEKDGTGVGDVEVTFEFNGQVKTIKTNSNGRAKVQFDRADGRVYAEASDFPDQSMSITAPECGEVSENSDSHTNGAGGQVLGASTLAATGNQDLYQLVATLSAGVLLTSISAYGYKKTSKK